jgi:outer membrane protein assembly factor BamB
MVYIGSCAGSFLALDRGDGHAVWSYDTTPDSDKAQFHGDILIDGELVVVGSDAEDDGYLYAFDAATGDTQWRQAAPGGFPSDVVKKGSRAFAVSASGRVWCVDLETGDPVWSHGGVEDAHLHRSSIVVADQKVIVNSPVESVLALSIDSGEPIWETALNAAPNTELAIFDDGVYVGDLEGRVHRLALADGKKVATLPLERPVYGALQFEGGCLLAMWAEDSLGCADPSLEGLTWSRQAASKWSSFHPVVHDGVVISGTTSGEIHAIDLSTGDPLWTHKLEGQIKGLELSGNVLYVGTLQGRVYALRIAAD